MYRIPTRCTSTSLPLHMGKETQADGGSEKGSQKSGKSIAQKATATLSKIKCKAVNILTSPISKKKKTTKGSECVPDKSNAISVNSSSGSLTSGSGMAEDVAEDEENLETSKKKWTSPIYAFYEPVPGPTYNNKRRCHEFKCLGRSCKYTARCYLDTKDKSSTGNLITHVKSCWGEPTWEAAKLLNNADEVNQSRGTL
ncbi:hypothetical protein CPB84DRAFT_1750936 [Gymnopilus junonius]|uniref:Uncharacterized protein n=2 Tax=Gymnopilus junonius TaxID=109634 RepID=A0A9P5NDN4_GYMJU|nr:hypothetical protein CPB84DRAFT_1750936 [Gymnopilus junonius]